MNKWNWIYKFKKKYKKIYPEMWASRSKFYIYFTLDRPLFIINDIYFWHMFVVLDIDMILIIQFIMKIIFNLINIDNPLFFHCSNNIVLSILYNNYKDMSYAILIPYQTEKSIIIQINTHPQCQRERERETHSWIIYSFHIYFWMCVCRCGCMCVNMIYLKKLKQKIHLVVSDDSLIKTNKTSLSDTGTFFFRFIFFICLSWLFVFVLCLCVFFSWWFRNNSIVSIGGCCCCCCWKRENFDHIIYEHLILKLIKKSSTKKN